MNQTELFKSSTLASSESPEAKALENNKDRPLAHKMRPESIRSYFGQELVFKRFPFLTKTLNQSLVLWGPPGCGKTTLAYILAKQSELELYTFNAVLSGVPELRKLIKRVQEAQHKESRRSVIFIDEIHRFNKAQQDALLPHVESGDFIFIGATTENPVYSLNRALLSRVQSIALGALDAESILNILKEAVSKNNLQVPEETLDFISEYCDGDARKALNTLQSLMASEQFQLAKAKDIILESCRDYDKNSTRHYDIISAFIKSMRGSDPDSALLYLAIMLDGGEDPVFIARRLVIFASEDIGNADPSALSLATAGLSAVQNIGMPEARINLAQVTTYLASTYKSNRAYKALDQALAFVRENSTITPPDSLKNHPPKNAKPYLYPHDFPGHFVLQEYAKIKHPPFYRPSEQGKEAGLKQRLAGLWKNKHKS